jgi:hypothetical protein
VSLDDWILALHLLAAFAFVGALTILSVAVVALRSVERPTPVLAVAPLIRVGEAVVVVGVLGTIVFGVWLAISLDAYRIWDGWIIASIVLWAASSEIGRRSGVEYGKATKRAAELRTAGHDATDAELAALVRSPTALGLHAVSTLLALVILALMIWKPGA